MAAAASDATNAALEAVDAIGVDAFRRWLVGVMRDLKKSEELLERNICQEILGQRNVPMISLAALCLKYEVCPCGRVTAECPEQDHKGIQLILKPTIWSTMSGLTTYANATLAALSSACQCVEGTPGAANAAKWRNLLVLVEHIAAHRQDAQ